MEAKAEVEAANGATTEMDSTAAAVAADIGDAEGQLEEGNLNPKAEGGEAKEEASRLPHIASLSIIFSVRSVVRSAQSLLRPAKFPTFRMVGAHLG